MFRVSCAAKGSWLFVLGGALSVAEMCHDAPVMSPTVASAANVSGEQMMQAAELASPVMASLGATPAHIAAMIGGAGNVGIQGKKAGHVLAGLHSRFADPKPRALAALERKGLEYSDFMKGGRKLTGADLEKTLANEFGLSEAELKKYRKRLDKIMSGGGSNHERSARARDYLMENENFNGAEDRKAFSDSMANFANSGNGKFDLVDVIDQFEKHGMELRDYNAVFGLHMGKYSMAISSQVDRIRELEAMVNNEGVKNLSRMAKEMMQGLYGDVQLFITQLAILKDRINTVGFAEYMTNTAKKGRKFMEFLTNLSAETWRVIGNFAKWAALLGPVAMGFGAVIRLAAFSLAPFTAVAAAMATMTLRTVAFSASMLSLSGIRLLLSPLGLVAGAVAGVGVAFMYAVKDSDAAQNGIFRLKLAYSELVGVFQTGDFTKLHNSLAHVKYALAMFGIAAADVGKKWLENSVGPQRYASALASLNSIIESASNAFGNINAAVGGFFSGLADGLGLIRLRR